LHKEENL